MRQSILIVDDMPDMRRMLEKLILRSFSNVDVRTAASGEDALKIIHENNIGVVLADVRMRGMDGIELLKRIKKINESVTVILMTAYGSIESAVDALKLGAYDYITKPFDEERLLHVVMKAIEHYTLVQRNLDLERRIKEKEAIEGFVGESARIKRLVETIQLVANTDVTVLITGETGTGKDLTARMIHALSSRANKPFVAVNCPAIPENILESELFGYKKGAFTGAIHDKEGLFQTAGGGTIFLDEIGDISPVLQAKLLRVLQEKEIKPLGDTHTYKVDARIIASTNQNLEEKIKTGQFREDLYYRLNVVSIQTPSLREIPEDIPLIANHFLLQYCPEFGVSQKRFSEDVLKMLVARKWNGNVREIQNEIKRAVIFSKGDVIAPDEFGFEPLNLPCPDEVISTVSGLEYKDARKSILERFNVQYITQLLNDSEGNVTLAAKKAGIERQSLQHLMRKYDINSNKFRK
ncbi:MAG: sigma-54 dependent transcriptional regulator [Nitrospirae bacterium]|nr:sigma-54 dependent transcriptional regulator [Nitrospirota bacterium]MCL5063446.1 sigma-54 dependent transcriptional regulator [Nitrospirota bacterium]MDA8338456.1 sigma-54 dependent transcriptional regulator [Nitrospiraceae bacterium]